MTDTLGFSGYEPRSSPAERRAQFDLRRLIEGNATDIAANATDIAALEALTTPTAWTGATYATNWEAYGGGYGGAEYRKVGDVVQLQGLVRRVTAATAASGFVEIFTLPSGFRPPSYTLIFVVPAWVSTNYTLARQIRIKPDGTVNAFIETNDGAYPVNGWLSLSGLTFSVTA